MVPHRAACAVCPGQHDVEKADGLSKRLECGAALPDAAVRPGKQDSNAVFLRERGERFQAPHGDETMQARVPQIKQLKKLRAVVRTRIIIHGLADGFGDAQLQSGRPAFRTRKESFANVLQRAFLAKSEIQRSTQS